MLGNDAFSIILASQLEDIESLAKRLDPIDIDPPDGGGEGGGGEGGGSEDSSPLSDPPPSEDEGSEGDDGQEHPNTESASQGADDGLSGNNDPSRPPGLDDPAEQTLWDTFTDIVNNNEFSTLGDEDEVLLYTGPAAASNRNNFMDAFSAQGKSIRHMGNIFNKVGITNARSAYRTSPGAKPWVDGAVASNKIAEIMSKHPRQGHVLFSSAADAAQAAAGNLPSGFMKFYEINTVTGEGTQVPKLFIWDVNTYETNIANKDYNPPLLWQAGQPALGPGLDFTVQPR